MEGRPVAGTDELVLEAKGVELDVRVPVTLESEPAKSQGGDPVLDAGIETLKQKTAESLAANVTLVDVTGAGGIFTAVAPEGWARQGATTFIAPSDTEFLVYTANTPPVADGLDLCRTGADRRPREQSG